ncbi:MAG TPA: hypothetical protein VM492_09025 [Sumerlaeia bacterium]|nr:hypothetical protein [Sumerlaeia bacterium]
MRNRKPPRDAHGFQKRRLHLALAAAGLSASSPEFREIVHRVTGGKAMILTTLTIEAVIRELIAA